MVEATVKDVWFKYPGAKDFVLQSFNWTNKKPRAIGLLGINGCGKTTFMKLLAGILKPTRGEIRINGKLIKNVNSTKNFVGFVPENAKLFLVGPTIRKDLLRIIKDDNLVDSLLDEFKFAPLTNKKLYHLSEGQRRLFAIFSAFHLPRKILFFDEPTIGLDTRGRELFSHLIQKSTDEGKMIFIATNDPRILPYLDHLLVIREGASFMEGPPKEVLYRLEKETELVPNQIVRLITGLREKYENLPPIVSVKEFNEVIFRREQ
ncbi:MAG: energy-coupling factor ABC transporter ATP-binding protein [Candidatus Hodarchaeota archaeon]